MPYKNIVFVKLEKRLLNDPRWYMMGEISQLNFIRFILLAAETYNKIPKNLVAIKKAFKTDQDLKILEASIEEIRLNFPKLKQNKDFYYFDKFNEKTNYISPKEKPRKSQVIPKGAVYLEKDIDKEKEKEKDLSKTHPKHLEDVINFFEKQLHIPPATTNIIGSDFWDYYESNGWKIGGKAPMRDWKAAARRWARNNHKSSPAPAKPQIQRTRKCFVCEKEVISENLQFHIEQHKTEENNNNSEQFGDLVKKLAEKK